MVENNDAPPDPRWDVINDLATKMEKIFFEESAEAKLSVMEQDIMINRVKLLFDEFKYRKLLESLIQESTEGQSNPDHFQ